MRIALLCSDPGVPLGGVKGASVHLRAFAAALERLAFEPALRGRLGAEARRTVERQYTWDAVIGRVLRIATGLAAREEGSWRT